MALQLQACCAQLKPLSRQKTLFNVNKADWQHNHHQYVKRESSRETASKLRHARGQKNKKAMQCRKLQCCLLLPTPLVRWKSWSILKHWSLWTTLRPAFGARRSNSWDLTSMISDGIWLAHRVYLKLYMHIRWDFVISMGPKHTVPYGDAAVDLITVAIRGGEVCKRRNRMDGADGVGLIIFFVRFCPSFVLFFVAIPCRSWGQAYHSCIRVMVAFYIFLEDIFSPRNFSLMMLRSHHIITKRETMLNHQSKLMLSKSTIDT